MIAEALSPATSRTSKLDQSRLSRFSSDESRNSVDYSLVRRNEDNTSLPRKPSYSSLQYSTIDHSKTIRARNKNQNQTSSLGPKITSPKPSLSLEKIQGKKSSPILTIGSNSIPDKVDGDGKEASVLLQFLSACFLCLFFIKFLRPVELRGGLRNPSDRALPPFDGGGQQ